MTKNFFVPKTKQNLVLILVACLVLIVLAFVLPQTLLAPQDTPSPSGNATIVTEDCLTAGCSGSICIDKDSSKSFDGIITTCDYTALDACYDKFGICEKQSNGKCGWTQTPALLACKLPATSETIFSRFLKKFN